MELGVRYEEGETEEMGLGRELKLGQVPRLRCSEAVRDGFEAEKTASHKEHRSLTALGKPVSVEWTRTGSRCAQYQAPLPFIAFVRTVTSPSYRLCTAFAATSSAEELPDSTAGAAGPAGDVDAIATQQKKLQTFNNQLCFSVTI